MLNSSLYLSTFLLEVSIEFSLGCVGGRRFNSLDVIAAVVQCAANTLRILRAVRRCGANGAFVCVASGDALLSPLHCLPFTCCGARFMRRGLGLRCSAIWTLAIASTCLKHGFSRFECYLSCEHFSNSYADCYRNRAVTRTPLDRAPHVI